MEIEKLIESITAEVIGSIEKQNLQQISNKSSKYDASYAGYCDHTVLKAYQGTLKDLMGSYRRLLQQYM